jgi:hypothetical protein
LLVVGSSSSFSCGRPRGVNVDMMTLDSNKLEKNNGSSEDEISKGGDGMTHIGLVADLIYDKEEMKIYQLR